jgi:hypothetical protein
MLSLIALSVSGCSPEPDIRSLLGEGGELPPGVIEGDESIIIEVREGEQFVNGSPYEDTLLENVFIEIGADGNIYSRRIRLWWGDDEALIPERSIETLDQKTLEDDHYKSLRQRLAVYRPPADHPRDYIFKPKDCGVVLGGTLVAGISFGVDPLRGDHFTLPPYCEAPADQIIRQDLRAILASLPPLKGIDQYTLE